jgi:uncharacterized damage-inducible protein DinB
MAKEAIMIGFNVTQVAVLSNLSEIPDDELTLGIGASGNSMLWIGQHILAGRSEIMNVVSQFIFGSERAANQRTHVPRDGVALINALVTSYTDFTQTMIEVKDSDLKRSVPQGVMSVPVSMPTIETFFIGAIFHEAYHAGQLGIARRALGKAGVFG